MHAPGEEESLMAAKKDKKEAHGLGAEFFSRGFFPGSAAFTAEVEELVLYGRAKAQRGSLDPGAKAQLAELEEALAAMQREDTRHKELLEELEDLTPAELERLRRFKKILQPN
jgi:hypothetical protein